jgi:hypothetical protein
MIKSSSSKFNKKAIFCISCSSFEDQDKLFLKESHSSSFVEKILKIFHPKVSFKRLPFFLILRHNMAREI